MDFKGKKGLVMGVANERSIAWSISQLACQLGAEVCFSYQHPLLVMFLVCFDGPARTGSHIVFSISSVLLDFRPNTGPDLSQW